MYYNCKLLYRIFVKGKQEGARKMFDGENNLYEEGEHVWGKLVISDGLLQELSDLQCTTHDKKSDLFQQFFVQQSDHESVPVIWNMSSLSEKERISETKCKITSAEQEQEIIHIDDADDVAEENKGAAGGGSLQNAVLNLICSLDEQSATSEQLNSASDQLLEPVLMKLSDSGLCHICTLVCSMSASEQSRLGSLICRHLIVPRLQNPNHEPCSRAVINTILQFTKSFPHLSCAEVLLPVMLASAPPQEEGTLLKIITEALSPSCQEYLLRSFLEHEPSKLNEWQIPFLQELLTSSCGDTVRQQLVQLVAVSADDLSRNTRFTKLLVSVIQQFGTGVPSHMHQQLVAAVSCNKTVLKRAAEKALRTL